MLVMLTSFKLILFQLDVHKTICKVKKMIAGKYKNGSIPARNLVCSLTKRSLCVCFRLLVLA